MQHMTQLDLTALRYFGETAACGSIRQAADRLHVTPSAVSRQIAKLEARLKVPLLERSPEGVRLTQAGQLLAEEVGAIHRLVDRLQSRIADIEGLRRGTVAVRCMEGAIDKWLPAAVTEFHGHYAEVRYDINVSNTDATIESLLKGECDIGITFKAPRRSEIGVVATNAAPLLALVHPDHALAQRSAVRMGELLKHPMVLPSPAFGVRRVLDQLFKLHRSGPSELVTVNSIAMARAMVRQGAVVSVLPAFSASHDLSSGHLISVPILDAGHLRAEVELCVRKGHVLPAAPREFLMLLKERFHSITS
jgi:DNA-binding transcriptional LysR family regulator